MNKPKVDYLRHRWSSKSGYRFRCLRRGCTATSPQGDHPVCCERGSQMITPWIRKATHGGGIGPFGKKSPRDRTLGPSGKTSASRRARKSALEDPKPRNRSARRKRRDRRQARMKRNSAFEYSMGPSRWPIEPTDKVHAVTTGRWTSEDSK